MLQKSIMNNDLAMFCLCCLHAIKLFIINGLIVNTMQGACITGLLDGVAN